MLATAAASGQQARRRDRRVGGGVVGQRRRPASPSLLGVIPRPSDGFRRRCRPGRAACARSRPMRRITVGHRCCPCDHLPDSRFVCGTFCLRDDQLTGIRLRKRRPPSLSEHRQDVRCQVVGVEADGAGLQITAEVSQPPNISNLPFRATPCRRGNHARRPSGISSWAGRKLLARSPATADLGRSTSQAPTEATQPNDAAT